MRKGIIIILIGIGLFFISMFASEGYEEKRSLMGNIYSMEVVIDPGRLEWGKPVKPVPKDENSGPRSKEKYELSEAFNKLREIVELSTPRIVGRKSIPLSFLLSLSTIITLVGIGKIVLSKTKMK